jgi:signal transduction histidine kinase
MSAGKMTGIEYELMMGFKQFIKNQHNIDLDIKWKEGKTFIDTYTTVRDSRDKGVFGAATFSITEGRKNEIGFSPHYMPDISILISSKNIPIVKNVDEFDKVFSKLKAITVKGTTYDEDLQSLKQERDIDFDIKYIPVDYVIQEVQKTNNAFGFITLPNYLTFMNKNAELSITRQNLYPKKREGYAFIYPMNSDWSQPIQEYFTSTQFQSLSKTIIDRYFKNNVYEFIENLFYNADDVSLLIHEKEVQTKDLLEKDKQIEVETNLRKNLIILITVILVFLVIIYLQYQKRSKANKILQHQKEDIEKQRISIERQNIKLETQNEKLIQLNEEKNHLIKILAHDLRSPINIVHGMAKVYLIENPNLSDEQKGPILNIIECAKRLNKMIGKILDVDAIENDRINVTLEKINVCELIKKVAENFKPVAETKSIHLQLNVEKETHFITADVLYFTEIIENLISNAIKFSENGKQVDLTISEHDSSIRMCVKDEGPGLTTEDKEKLFQKYQQLSAKPTAGEPSTGLGLSIVKKYVELMNGKVWCESEVGMGAKFCIEFPVA